VAVEKYILVRIAEQLIEVCGSAVVKEEIHGEF
jgi:hypothetical protein